MAPTGIRDQVAIVSMGCTAFGEHWGSAAGALNPLGLRPQDVDAFWIGTYSSGFSGLTLSRALRVRGKSVTRVENMCATGSDALRNACYAVAAGACDIALMLGAEKLKDSGYTGLTRMPIPSDGTGGALGTTTAPANFSLLAPAYAARYGVDPAELKEAFTRIAWKNHHNGARNPLAQFRHEVAREKIAASPLVAGDLGILDCSGVSDGAAAAVVVRAEDAHRWTEAPLYVKALAMVAGAADGNVDPGYDFTGFPPRWSQARGRPTGRRGSATRGRAWRWPRCTTASRSPRWC